MSFFKQIFKATTAGLGLGSVLDTLKPASAEMTSAAQTPPPVIEDTQGRMQDQADMIKRRKGRASTVLTKRDAPAPTTASKQLLGQ